MQRGKGFLSVLQHADKGLYSEDHLPGIFSRPLGGNVVQ